jgi:hypothetical protein
MIIVFELDEEKMHPDTAVALIQNSPLLILSQRWLLKGGSLEDNGLEGVKETKPKPPRTRRTNHPKEN